METYRCGRCGLTLPPASFSPSQLSQAGRWCRICRNARQRDRRYDRDATRVTDACLTCGKDIRHMRPHARWCSPSCSARGWRASNPGRHRELLLKSVYGLTPGQFRTLFFRQGQRCAICGTTKPPGTGRKAQWNVDHDHATGRVRGILCSPCNTGMGMLKDDPALLRRAADYVEGIALDHVVVPSRFRRATRKT